MLGCTKEASKPVIYPPFVYTDSVSDIEGNYYHTVTIGTQVWMAENLRTNHYRNGDTITYTPYIEDWNTFAVPAVCMYNNDTVAEQIYGDIYNFRSANEVRNVCPVGWHIPTNSEWQTLIDFVGTDAGKKLMEDGTLHWSPPSTGSTNEFGFAALPSRWRSDQGYFENIRLKAYFWSSSNYVPFNINYPEGYTIEFNPLLDTSVFIGHSSYFTGCSIRCVKD